MMTQSNPSLDEEKLKEILSYILEVPTDASDKSRAFKFPYVSSQVLSADVKLIMDFFIKPDKAEGDEEQLTEEKKYENFK